ncbi:nickel-dependent lactate racemase [Clostridium ganghwense]|uniref:Nickel-dependent lactate racemase n=1 Tax=Clostridium ganghwense TaxID=312089 RepID=A0ABT4CKI6_9CLOT|nr:nickel-dependent lactate racemase [Clostridium ganghwense]MCY6369561.1 nickel-dependent lactate racemase [Clostridium ganghwense]
MLTFNLPYGRGEKKISIPKERVAAKLVSKAHEFKPEGTEIEIVREALTNPISSKPLSELVKGKENVVIISSDHTRPVPSHVTMPILLDEIRKGNANAKISILVATGMHRATTKEELIDKYGEEIANNENFIIHDSQDDSQLVKVGTLPSGGELIINKYAVEADLLIAEGFIEPHFFAGFSGGRKSILPGIASKATILANHCSEFVGSNYARTGNLEGNPLHKDMLYAAEKANLAFILNVVIDSDKKVIGAFAGNREQAHYNGCEFVKDLAGVNAVKADIAISTNGGYPLDQNIYQSVKGMTAAEATLGEKGVIIMVSMCNDGHGGEEFYETFKNANSVKEIMNEIVARDRHETISDQWESQVLARILLKYDVIMVTGAPRKMIEDMHMKWAPSVDVALEMADEILGTKDGKITVIPDGVSVVVKK